MKKLIDLIPVFILVLSFVSCKDDETGEPERLNLSSICTTYSSDKVESTYNGMDFALSTGVTLSLEDPANYDASKPDARMVLTMPSPWPDFFREFKLIEIPIDATSYQDYMTYTGTYVNSMLTINVSGFCRNGVLSIDMDYTDTYDTWVKIGKTYEYELSPDALNLFNIYTGSKVVKWKGENYDCRSFVRMALAPVLNRISENIGGNILTMTVSKDSKLSLGSRMETGGTIKPIAGTFLMSGRFVAYDALAAETINKLFFAYNGKEPLYKLEALPTHYYTQLQTGIYPNLEQSSFAVVSFHDGPGFMSGGALQNWENLFQSEGDEETAEMLQTLRSLELNDLIMLYGTLKE